MSSGWFGRDVNTTPNIILDLDGVIVDLIGTAFRRSGVPMPWDNAPAWNVKTWGLTPDQIVSVTRELYSPVTALEADPIDGAIDAWRILERLGNVHVVTARDTRYLNATRQWLAHHQLVPTSLTLDSNKGEVATKLGATIVFDDSPKQIAQYVAAGVPAIYRPDYAYNRHCPGIAYTSWKHCFEQEPLASLLDTAIKAEAERIEGETAA